MSSAEMIQLSGCRQHNLRDLNVSIPALGLTLITGPSGAGKSSLAFATLHAESRRRYLESLSTSERRRFDHIAPPQLDEAQNLPLTVAVRPDTPASGPRNTLGTEAGLIGILQMMFASGAECICPDCGAEVRVWQVEEILEALAEIPDGTRAQIGFPLQQQMSGQEAVDWLQVAGFQRVVHEGKVIALADLADVPAIEECTVLVDRIKIGSTNKSRVRESLELCQRAGRGRCVLFTEEIVGQEGWEATSLDGQDWWRRVFSRERDCLQCGRSILDPEPSLFRWTSPSGACATCRGRGWVKSRKETKVCEACDGTRLNADARAYRLEGASLPELHQMTVRQLADWIASRMVESLSRDELRSRMEALQELGFANFPLATEIASLSSTERTTLALCQAAVDPLAGALYLLEEPYSGHPESAWSKIDGVVESILSHGAGVCLVQADDEAVLRSSHLKLDQILRLGPGAGDQGGRIVDESSTNADPIKPPDRECETGRLDKLDWPWMLDTALEIAWGGITVLSGPLAARPIGFLREVLRPSIQEELESGRLTQFEQVHSLGNETRKPHPRQTVLAAIQAFGVVRQLLAETDDAKKQNVTAGDFSLHKKEGTRCPRCEGSGRVSVELDFLPEFELPCPECGGSRYDSRVDDIRFRGLTLPDIFQLTAEQAFRTFKGHHRLQKRLQLLKQVQLGYLRLGQSLTELSRGERQRLRLAAALAKIRGTKTLLLIEELSIGLAAEELPSLLSVLREFTTAGHSVLLVDPHPFWEKYSDKFQKFSA
ncbi:MAG: hypothetical protein HUJ26_24205 [Planctomycetaceae bacterium]|nr:hypothetical protein [Planctomycetaceae bacterium]